MADYAALMQRYSDEVARNAKFERALDNDLYVATGKVAAQVDLARGQLDIHDERVREMPWYERAFTYIERRYERQELVKQLDRAEDRAEVAYEIADAVRGTLKRYEQSREQALQPERELSRE